MSKATEWVSVFDNVKSVRSQYDYDFQRLNRYLASSSVQFYGNKTNDGNVNRSEIYDSTAERACDDLASSLMSLMISPLADKFTLIAANKDQRKSKRVNDYLYSAKEWICEHLSRSDTCFYKTGYNVFRSIVRYGDGPFFAYRDTAKKLQKFSSIPKQEAYFQRDTYGKILSYFRSLDMTPIQILKEFGDEPTCEYNIRDWDYVKEKLKADPNLEIKVVNVVYERALMDRDLKKDDPKNKKYGSLWIDYDKKKILKESGYDYWPFYAPVWTLDAGEDYGRGPGHRALPDIVTLNVMEKKNLAAAELMITPPLIMPYDVLDGDVDLSPAAINYINLSRAMFGTQFVKPEPLNIVQNLPITVEMQDRKRNQILLAFFNDLLENDKRAEMSATESSINYNDRTRRFNGPLANIESDFLEPIIMLTYESGIAFGELEPPDELEGVLPVFTTAVYQMQQMMRLQALQNAAAVLTQFAANGQVIQGLKREELAPYVFKATGADTNLLEDPEIVKQQVAQSEQVNQDNLDAASFKDAAGGLKDLQQAMALSRGL